MAYEYLVVPYGGSIVPCTFTKCVEAVLSPSPLSPSPGKSICIMAYLDDWALIASSREQVMVQLSLILINIQTLGVSVYFQKTLLVRSQQFSSPQTGDMPWSYMFLYIFLPMEMILSVLVMVCLQGLSLILVALH